MDDLDNKAIQKLLHRVGSEIVDIAQENAPYVTGNLHNDIQMFDEHLRDLEIEVGNSLLTPYARFVHDGTKPHVIKPKRKKALKTPYGVFKKVNHPGTKAQPYLSDAVKSYISSGAFERAMNETGDAISEEIFEGLKSSLKNIEIK